MNPAEKRKLENELITMGLPSLNDPALVEMMASMINGYPIPDERVGFFCDLLNECEGSKRSEMYTAMRPHLHFEVPSLFDCEAAIAAKAERMIRPRSAKHAAVEEVPITVLSLDCGGCDKKAEFRGLSTADAMSTARKAGWGRGPIAGKEFCADCRANAYMGSSIGATFTRRWPNAVDA